MRFPAALAALISLAPLSGWAASAPTPALEQMGAQMLAHRALYNLTYDAQASRAEQSSSDIVAARGTMGYEVIDACDGWAVRQRLRMTITNSDGEDVQMASDYATWESKDGLKFRFHMKQMTDNAVTSQTDGDAALTSVGGTGEEHYVRPRDENKSLPVGLHDSFFQVFPPSRDIMITPSAPTA